ncbi:MAG TPA: DUF6599 family protein [Bryobacteraceae bacterium]
MKFPSVAVAVVISATALGAASAIPSAMPGCDVTPGWTQAGALRTYTADTLYDYMDGNSEGYLIYGFQQMRGVTCKSGEASFVVDISQMNDAESAWGLFASNRDPRVATEAIGVAGQIVPQRGIFVKGSTFVEISANPGSTDHTAALRQFLKGIEARVDGTTSAPGPVTWFPQQGLDAASVRLIPQSLLGLSLLKKGYLAKYDFGRAFVVRQASPEAAAQVMQKLRDRFGAAEPVKTADEAFQADDRYLGHLVMFRKGPYVAGFVNLSEGTPAVQAAGAFCAAIPQ